MNKALVFKKVPNGYPVPGEDVAIDSAAYGADVATPTNGIVIQSMYASFDPYMRAKMRPAEAKSYSPAFVIGAAMDSLCIGKVVRSNTEAYAEGDVVIGYYPIQEVVALDEASLPRIRKLENPLGLDIRLFLGALGMPGLTAFSSLYEIGKPKRGETIFVSAASGAVGQIVGQLAKHEGLKVIGSVGSDEKLKYIIDELGFDGGFNYKKEKPSEALARLAPEGIDIYYENVGGEHLAAALDAMNDFGRVVVCGLISQYNSAPYPITNLQNIVAKRLAIRGFIVGDPGFADVYRVEHQKKVQAWIKDGTFKALTHETVGIDNAPEGLVGIFYGKNMGKAVLKF
ncbi:hypothetical protein ASPZODRAFT_68819 [Penicilliopsis zonata CBS 506.65]|uniref:Enoyl reductase (ER) domain-containing protein n=1 Tax=Penicilliopsis zonata CBS 506.65 TaxID=1073090 RepID=A0A1L9SES9_9EURO|nr:hypothetical protein ASPZODRAFT_68819 [Penicilliopsis zonata CBS 506.65]OJJ45662.1 hypothetical protein ASPZODRAFT_68819 [Penicilliopsis zonata CBS 506.65]